MSREERRELREAGLGTPSGEAPPPPRSPPERHPHRRRQVLAVGRRSRSSAVVAAHLPEPVRLGELPVVEGAAAREQPRVARLEELRLKTRPKCLFICGDASSQLDQGKLGLAMSQRSKAPQPRARYVGAVRRPCVSVGRYHIVERVAPWLCAFRTPLLGNYSILAHFELSRLASGM